MASLFTSINYSRLNTQTEETQTQEAVSVVPSCASTLPIPHVVYFIAKHLWRRGTPTGQYQYAVQPTGRHTQV